MNKIIKIYNLFPRLLGHINNWHPHIEKIKNMGFNFIYINPINYPGFSGSLYSIKNYYEYNPLFFTSKDKYVAETELRDFIKKCREYDIDVMLDFVINHSASDSVLTKEHPSWYKRDKKGNIKHPGAKDGDEYIEWGDLSEFDNEHSHDKANLYKYWENLLEYYINLGFMGFRADAAYKVPRRLWNKLIEKAKATNKNIIFWAESLGCTVPETIELGKAGFDYLSSSVRWWDYKTDWFLKDYDKIRKHAPSISFPENHDTVRTYEECDGNIEKIKQKALLSSMFAASWSITLGFEYGFKNRCNVVENTEKDYENINYDFSDYIKKLNDFKEKYTAFSEEGDIKVLVSDIHKTKEDHKKHTDKKHTDKYKEKKIFAFIKYNKNNHDKYLVISNMDSKSDKYISTHTLGDIEIKEDISIENRYDDMSNIGTIKLNPSEVKIFTL